MESFKLRNGVRIPANGFGVYQVSKEDCAKSVISALKAGYRHIDTAQAYFNEEEVGKGIEESDVDRKEIFLTTKVWIDHYGAGKTYESVRNSMAKLKTDYLDLILLHQPICDYHNAYKDLERLYKEGKVRAIGVSNFYPDRLVDLCLSSEIPPRVNQIEVNPLFQRNEDKKWADKYQVILEAWAPFAEGRNNRFKNETLSAIGQKYGKSSAQVILCWLYQRGIVSLAKSTHEERIKENFDVNSFALSDEDRKQIEALDTNTSSFFDHRNPQRIEWFYDRTIKRRNQK